MQDADETTQPGAPKMLTGPPEAQALAQLAAMLRFYGQRLEQFTGEILRAPPGESPLTEAQKTALGRDLRELGDDFTVTAARVAPRPTPPGTEPPAAELGEPPIETK
jgi:hypothetical protein